MKGIFVTLALFFALGALAQDNCSRYYPFKENTAFEIRSYGTDNNLIAISNYEVKDVWLTLKGEKAIIAATVEDGTQNKNSEPVLEIECTEENSIKLNYKSILPGFLMEKFSNLDYEVVDAEVEIPNDLQEGEKLPDAKITMNVRVMPIVMKVEYKMTNRTVEANETLHTPAGTFNCKVITYDTAFEKGLKGQGSAKQWIAEGIGLVKQIDYNNEGAIAGVNILTEFDQ